MASEVRWHLSTSDTTTTGDLQTTEILKLISEQALEPRVLSAATGTFSAVAIDDQLTLVYGQDVCSVCLGAAIDDFALLEGGYVVIAESSGNILLGSVCNGQFTVKQNYPLFSSNSEGQTYAQVLFYEESHWDADEAKRFAKVIALTVEGKLLVCSNILLHHGDIVVCDAKMKHLSASLENASDIAVTGKTIIAVGPQHVWVCNEEVDQVVFEETLSLKNICDVEMTKVCTLPEAPLFITMDATIYVWDVLTLTVLFTKHVPGAVDMRPVWETNTSLSISDIKLIAYTHSEVKVLTLPGLEASFTCDISKDVVSGMTRCPITQDDILLTQLQKVEDFDEIEITVSLKLFAEASPERRLKRLLAKRKFAEAEEFAKLYGLKYDLEPSLVQSLLFDSKATYEETKHHLDLCYQLLSKNKTGDSQVQDIFMQIKDAQHRLETYRCVFGEDNFSSEEWAMFQFENPLKMCSKLLRLSAEKAIALWDCFQEQLKEELKPGVLEQILVSLPDNISTSKIVDWLCAHIIPTVCRSDPEAIMNITNWLNKELVKMETSNLDSWPDEAIHLTSTLYNDLQTACVRSVDDLDTLPESCLKAKISNSKALDQIGSLVRLLQELKDLQSKYKFAIPLQRFKRESKESIALCMLSRVSTPSQLPNVLRTQFLPYVHSFKLLADEILVKHVEHLTQQQRQGSSEEMMRAVLDNITGPKEKIMAVQSLVKYVPLPIPDFVANLVQETLANSKHPLCKHLREQWMVKEASDIMRSIGINSSCAQTSLQVLDVAKYLVRQGRPFSQAEKILQAFNEGSRQRELHKFACRQKIDKGKIDELIEHINELPKETAVECCLFVISVAKSIDCEHDQPELAQAFKTKQLWHYEAALRVGQLLRKLLQDGFKEIEVHEQLSLVSQLKDLKLFYGLEVSLATLADKSKCSELFSETCEQYKGFALLRLVKLLNLTESDVIQILLSKFSHKVEEFQVPVAEKVIFLVSQLVEDMQFYASEKSCFHVILELLQTSCSDLKHLLDISLKLLRMLITYSRAEYIKPCQKLCQLFTVVQEIVGEPVQSSQDHSDVPPVWYPESMHLSQQSGGHMISQAFLDKTARDTAYDKAQDALNILNIGFITSWGDGYWSEEDESQVSLLMMELLESGQNYMALRVMNLIAHSFALHQGCQQFLASHKWGEKIPTEIIRKLLKSSSGSKMLSLALAICLPQKEGVTVLKALLQSCGSDYTSLKRMAIVAEAYAQVLGNEKLITSCQSVKVTAKWGVRLAKIGISFKNIDKTESLNKLVESPHCTVDILEEYFKDFNLKSSGLESHLIKHLQHHFAWDPELKKPSTKQQAKNILMALSDPVPVLNKLLLKTSNYNYEHILFLLEEIQARSSNREVDKGLQLLRYLNKYSRRYPPSSEETKLCDEIEAGDAASRIEDISGLDTSSFAPLSSTSQTRLPYHLLMQKKVDVMKLEINSETLVDFWLKIANVLGISSDKMAMRATINATDAYISGRSASTSKTSDVQNLMQTLLHLAQGFSDKESFLVYCNCFVEKLNIAEEKIIAVKSCVSYTEKWLQSITQDAERTKAMRTKAIFEKRLKKLTIINSLVQSGLWESVKGSLKQGFDPEEIIRTIYSLDIDLITKGDVNFVADTIGDSNCLEMDQLRLSLLEEWLIGQELNVDMEQTLTFDVTVGENQVDDSYTVARILLLLKSRDRDICLERLMDFFKEGEKTKRWKMVHWCLLEAQAV